jgi:hypothetical protein
MNSPIGPRVSEGEALEAAKRVDVSVEQLYAAIYRLDHRAAERVLSQMQKLTDRYKSEPALTTCENAYWRSTAAVASMWVDLGRYARSHELASLAFVGFLAGQKRRVDAGLGFMRCSNTKSTLAGALASAKWRDKSLLGMSPGPSVIWELMLTALDPILSSVQANPKHPGSLSERWNLQVQCLEIAKMMFACRSSDLRAVIRFLDEQLGISINDQAMHFVQEPVVQGQDWWYWDFEIAKMYILGQGNITDYDACHAKRLRYFRLHMAVSQCMLSNWAYERDGFRRGLSLVPVGESSIDHVIDNGRTSGGL